MVYGMLRHMKAELVVRDQVLFGDGLFWEVVVWKTPTNVPPTAHGYKYRLFYGRAGERIIGYDNERGKGDHRHYRNVEMPYEFSSVSLLLEDFEADIDKERGEKS
jgi:Family of unknown function (DUF6516)